MLQYTTIFGRKPHFRLSIWWFQDDETSEEIGRLSSKLQSMEQQLETAEKVIKTLKSKLEAYGKLSTVGSTRTFAARVCY